MAKQKESKLQRDIRFALMINTGGWYWKNHGNMYTVSGLPDLMGVVNGWLIAVEVKTPTGRVSKEQKAIIKRLNKEGAYAIVARSPEAAVRRVSRWLAKKQVEATSVKSREVSPKKKGLRLVHGAGNWQDDNRLARHFKKVA